MSGAIRYGGDMHSDALIEAAFGPLLGQPCWGVQHHRQLNLSMNFGQPSLSIREPVTTTAGDVATPDPMSRRNVTVRGEYWLWLRYCFWQISRSGERIATGSSSQRRIERAICDLDGEQLQAVAVDPRTGSTEFMFDLGSTLHCRRFERDSTDELWLLYQPNGQVLVVNGDGTVRQEE